MALRVFALAMIAVFIGLAATDHPAAIAGIYEVNLRVKGTAGRKVTLNLEQDGKASLRNELVGKDVKTSTGQWSATGDVVRVEFESGTPAPMVWKVRKNRLIPAEKGGLDLRRPR
jgi:hypothetical protein